VKNEKVGLAGRAVPLLVAHATMADKVAVGTCQPTLSSFTTIQGAVSSVPPGSTTSVCWGFYAEQVTISQALTLEGIDGANLNQVVVTVPSGGRGCQCDQPVWPGGRRPGARSECQPLNITKIAVDGTGGDQACATSGTWLLRLWLLWHGKPG